MEFISDAEQLNRLQNKNIGHKFTWKTSLDPGGNREHKNLCFACEEIGGKVDIQYKN
jgi:hypothetical protein